MITTLVVLAVLAVLAVLFAAVAAAGSLLRTPAPAAVMRDVALRCTTTEAKRKFLEDARSADHVRDALGAWTSRGLSPEGLLYAEGLQRLGELGADLTEAERAKIVAADAAWKHGKGLPPITGRMRS